MAKRSFPDWPRGLSNELAAAYAGLGISGDGIVDRGQCGLPKVATPVIRPGRLLHRADPCVVP